MRSEQHSEDPGMPGREAEMPGNDSSSPAADPDRNLTPSGEAAGPADTAKGDGGEKLERDIGELLSEAESQRDEYLDLAKRTKADFENFRKRSAADTQAASQRGKAEVVRDVVPALDDLERAIKAAGLDPEGDAEDALAHGVLLVYRGLRETLARNGVEVVDPTGQKFDPNHHEALSTQPYNGVDSGVVVEVMQMGYRLGDQLLRPARVVVSA